MITDNTKRIPDGDEIKGMYSAIEREVMPTLRYKAEALNRRTRGAIEVDDAIQEGRMAILQALQRYDYNKAHGHWRAYVGRVLDNTYRDMLNHHATASRLPRVHERFGDEWVERWAHPSPLDEAIASACASEDASQEDQAIAKETQERLRLVPMKMINRLKRQATFTTTRDIQVYECLVNPDLELVKIVGARGGDTTAPDSEDIAKRLGLHQNAVDWSLHKIRCVKTALLYEEFIDLYAGAVKKGWPMVHTSPNYHLVDEDFIRHIMVKRSLAATEAGEVQEVKRGRFWRRVQRYGWGATLAASSGKEYRTLVIEGSDFNVRDGIVYGKSGARIRLFNVVKEGKKVVATGHVPWYGRLSKELNGGAHVQ